MWSQKGSKIEMLPPGSVGQLHFNFEVDYPTQLKSRDDLKLDISFYDQFDNEHRPGEPLTFKFRKF